PATLRLCLHSPSRPRKPSCETRGLWPMGRTTPKRWPSRSRRTRPTSRRPPRRSGQNQQEDDNDRVGSGRRGQDDLRGETRLFVTLQSRPPGRGSQTRNSSACWPRGPGARVALASTSPPALASTPTSAKRATTSTQHPSSCLPSRTNSPTSTDSTPTPNGEAGSAKQTAKAASSTPSKATSDGSKTRRRQMPPLDPTPLAG